MIFSSILRTGIHSPQNIPSLQREAPAPSQRPLPLPGDLSSISSLSGSAASSSAPSSEVDIESDTGEGVALHESDTILPAFAPSAAPSTQASVHNSAVGTPLEEPFGDQLGEAALRHSAETGEYESSNSEEGTGSTVLGESYVRI